jgi:hypothetical protein
VRGEGRLSCFLGVDGGWRFGSEGLDGEFLYAKGDFEPASLDGNVLDASCVFASRGLDGELVEITLRAEDAVPRA